MKATEHNNKIVETKTLRCQKILKTMMDALIC